MIRKLQQLKAKKGFTLVELMVVIAIIGVLAAILIPLMANFIINARISSHNSTAATYRSQMTYFLAEQQQRDAGYPQAAPQLLNIETDGGTPAHTVTGIAGWSAVPPQLGAGLTWEQALGAYLDDNNPDTPDTAQIFIVIAANSAHASLYVADKANIGSAALAIGVPVGTGDVFTFTGVTNGRTDAPDRFVVGTAPQQ